VTQSTDENGYAVREYKDLEGQMILKGTDSDQSIKRS